MLQISMAIQKTMIEQHLNLAEAIKAEKMSIHDLAMTLGSAVGSVIWEEVGADIKADFEDILESFCQGYIEKVNLLAEDSPKIVRLQ